MMKNEVLKVMVELEYELELLGYRMKVTDLKAAAEYIINFDYQNTIDIYAEKIVDDFNDEYIWNEDVKMPLIAI